MDNIIERLKDKKQAQPFGLRSEVEKEVLKTAGKSNTLYYDGVGNWMELTNPSWCIDSTYILKPGYKPKPEYVDVPVENILDLLCVRIGCASDKPLYYVPAMPRFMEYYSEPAMECEIGWMDIATILHEGNKVYARFRKE